MIYENNCTLPKEYLEQFINQGLEGLPDLIRTLVNEAMQIERENFLGAKPYERSQERQGHANGYKPKTVKTRVGEVTFDIPQVREGGFYPRSLEKGMRSERALLLAKGHDFARITLVGVVDADATLFLPDFRSAERAFSLLTQVSGRAGRGVLPGRVLIQTRNPAHYVFGSVIGHDYENFYDQEGVFRRDMGYPPFGHLVNIVISGGKDETVEEAASLLAAWLQSSAGAVEVLGPAPCLLGRLRGKRRLQIVLKAASRPPLHQLLELFEKDAPRPPAGVKMIVDVDPVDMF